MINRTDKDKVEDRPFNRTFTLDSIMKSWDNIGVVFFARRCLENKKVRWKLDETVPNKLSRSVEGLQKKYTAIKIRLEEEGFNSEYITP